MMLLDPKFVAPNVTLSEPQDGQEWIYPYTVAPHYQSQNAGPWCTPHNIKHSCLCRAQSWQAMHKGSLSSAADCVWSKYNSAAVQS